MTLEARALCAFHGRIPALHEVDVAVPPSGIVTVVGPNGAGKSTLLAALMGRLPMSGEVRLDGTDLRFVSPERRVAMGLSLVPEQRDLFGTMSVADNLELGAFCWRRAGRRAIAAEMERVYALFPRLGERHAQLAHTLSGGERQMLALGRALMARPRILLLDEPSLGLAPLVVRDIFATVRRLQAQGVAILLVEQNARAAFEVADHAYVLEMGRVSLQGPAAEVARDARVADSYLGRAAAPSAAIESMPPEKLAA